MLFFKTIGVRIVKVSKKINKIEDYAKILDFK